ncbi:capsid protein [Human alphaherpesvirus 2]|uniref:Triplex capsid protein 1 n=1 Tax=Human herpesvirus 2 (strain HG52) TaxID=10315 RepID=TRX1_HHV2H|nr:RecName: Full=Triplex capsid protein 1 [Human herpesvirus 2 strain HG52]CAB06724.1 capsid protein [Human alphaherpesvirus 2]
MKTKPLPTAPMAWAESAVETTTSPRELAGHAPLRRVLRPPIARRDGPVLLGDRAPRRTASTMWLLGIDPAESSPGTRATRDDTEQAVDKILRGARRAGGLTVPGAPRYHLTRQVTLTDLCQPNAEPAGALLLALRHPTDLPHLARHRAPPGRQTERLAEAWGQLLEASALGSGRAESGCARAGLVSFNFLVAACAAAYDARDAAEAVRAHITTNYGGTRAGARLDRFSECLRAMVHTHVFPHEVMRFFGGLVSWVTQDELASVTAVCSGPQEATHTGHPGRPRSAVTIPACAFVDLDAELCLGGPWGAFLYLVFTYRQCRDQELCCVYVVKSQLPPRGLEAALERLFGRLRITNTIHGAEDMTPPPPNRNVDFPLAVPAASSQSPRCSASQVTNPQFVDRLYRWQPDLRGRPTARTCTYAAFAELGVMPDDSPRCLHRTERFGAVGVPVVILEGVVWRAAGWRACA